jgi:alkaline phosphatase D
MKSQIGILLISFVINSLYISSACSQAPSSTFSNSNETWTIAGNSSVTEPNYFSTGGNPGGFIDCVENTGNAFWFFVSPNSWSGNWTRFIGSTLRFDLKSFLESGTGDVHNVRIYSGTNYAAWDYPITPQTEWTHFEVDLTASNFDRISGTAGASFEGIMSNVTALWIRGDYGGNDRTGLDNVGIGVIPTVGEGKSLSWLLPLLLDD